MSSIRRRPRPSPSHSQSNFHSVPLIALSFVTIDPKARLLFGEFEVTVNFFSFKYQKLDSEQQEKVKELAKSVAKLQHTPLPMPIPEACSRAEEYIQEQRTPRLEAMAMDDIYPCSFPSLFGADVPAITKLLMPDKFSNCTWYGLCGCPCEELSNKMQDSMGDGLFIVAVNKDKPAGMSMDMYDLRLKSIAAKEDQALIFYGHGIYNRSDNIFVGEERLRDMIIRAQAQGFQFRRMCDVCS